LHHCRLHKDKVISNSYRSLTASGSNVQHNRRKQLRRSFILADGSV